METVLSTQQKALKINLDNSVYGTFAEIGAGQEVARLFFNAGKASGTIAKSMSAYDMTFSDAIYGREESGRYVVESRLSKMLDHEYDLICNRLSEERGKDTRFFAFANTVTTASKHRQGNAHGWMGVRFQTRPGGPYNDIVLHISMLDPIASMQQEVVGVLGVNLVYGTFTHLNYPEKLIDNLTENLNPGRVEIDMIRFEGPDLEYIDNRLMSLKLVENNLTSAAIIDPNGDVLQASEVLYNKAVFLLRGNFSPLTKVHLDMLESGLKDFCKTFSVKREDVIVFKELTMHHLQLSGKTLDKKDYLDRVDTMCSTGNLSLISNFYLFSDLKRFIRSKTKKPIGMVLGAGLLENLFKEDAYQGMKGGILEGFGNLVGQGTRLFIYPQKRDKDYLSIKNFKPPSEFKGLLKYLIDNDLILDLQDCTEQTNKFHSGEVLKMIQNKDPQWEQLVPKNVIKLIKERKLFGYKD